MSPRLAAALLAALTLAGCGGEEGGRASRALRPTADRFDERRAFALAREQVERYGARPAGSPASRRLAERLRALLPEGRFEAVAGGLRNVVGTLPGRRPALLIGAHYDTAADPPGYLGANDGAGGTAAVVELARALARRPAGGPELRFVLFDGEEAPAGQDFSYAGALRGSRAYVAAHRGEVGAMVLLDYVANRGLRLPRETGSDPALWARLRAAARRAGVARAFPQGSEDEIVDDHTPFTRAGVPAVDLIDWSYPWRHTPRDTIGKLSPAALNATGEAVAELVRSWPR